MIINIFFPLTKFNSFKFENNRAERLLRIMR